MIKSKESGHFSFYLVALVFVISTVIKLLYISGNNFAFTPDQGRDLIDIRQMVVTHTPRLVGPTTSVNGVLLGPFYYYFIAIPFILFGGSPAAIVIWQIAWFQMAALFIWYILRKKNLILANLTAILLLFSPVGFYTGRYFWNANVMPIFTVIFFACLLDTLWYRDNFRLIFLGLVAGISLQIEAAFGILFFPFAFLILLLNKFSPKDLLKLSLAFGVTLLPQALFEFRHGFLMTKTLIAGLSGSSADLGEKLPLAVRLTERYRTFQTAFLQSNHIGFGYLGPIFLAGFGYMLYSLVKSRKARPENLVNYLSGGFMILAFVFYLSFPQHLKHWYTFGLSVSGLLFLASSFAGLYQEGRVGRLLTWTFISATLYFTLLAHFSYLGEYLITKSSDPSNLANQLIAIDRVYQEADGRAFRVYNYVPSVYDYTYQYLFWWYGTKKYGYQPDEIFYLPGQPEYLANNQVFWSKKKLFTKKDFTFLIVQEDGEHQDRVFAWEGNFTKLCPVRSFTISPGLTVSKLETCSKNTTRAKP